MAEAGEVLNTDVYNLKLQDSKHAFISQENEIHEVQLTKKDGQSLGITIVGYSGVSDTGELYDIFSFATESPQNGLFPGICKISTHSKCRINK